jgi:hypothetical protein
VDGARNALQVMRNIEGRSLPEDAIQVIDFIDWRARQNKTANTYVIEIPL